MKFLNITTRYVENLVNNTNSVGKKLKTVLVCHMVRSDPNTGKNIYTLALFNSDTHSIVTDKDSTTEYKVMKAKMLESFAEYQKLESG